jgi:hypothetical protein
VPLGGALEVTANCAFTTIVNACVIVRGGFAESVSWSVKLLVPVAVGVPEMTPVLGFKVSPAGSEPLITDHVSGLTAPEADTAAL